MKHPFGKGSLGPVPMDLLREWSDSQLSLLLAAEMRAALQRRAVTRTILWRDPEHDAKIAAALLASAQEAVQQLTANPWGSATPQRLIDTDHFDDLPDLWLHCDPAAQRFAITLLAIGTRTWELGRHDITALLDELICERPIDALAAYAGMHKLPRNATPPGEWEAELAVRARDLVDALQGEVPLPAGERLRWITSQDDHGPDAHPLGIALAQIEDAVEEAIAHPDRPLGRLSANPASTDEEPTVTGLPSNVRAFVHETWFGRENAWSHFRGGSPESVLLDLPEGQARLELVWPDRGTVYVGRLRMQFEDGRIVWAELTQDEFDAFAAVLLTRWAFYGRFVADGDLRVEVDAIIAVALSQLVLGELPPLTVVTTLAQLIADDETLIVEPRHGRRALLQALDRRLGITAEAAAELREGTIVYVDDVDELAVVTYSPDRPHMAFHVRFADGITGYRRRASLTARHQIPFVPAA